MEEVKIQLFTHHFTVVTCAMLEFNEFSRKTISFDSHSNTYIALSVSIMVSILPPVINRKMMYIINVCANRILCVCSTRENAKCDDLPPECQKYLLCFIILVIKLKTRWDGKKLHK